MSDKVEIPIDSGLLVLKRKEYGMRRSNIGIDTEGNIIPNNNNNDAEYKVVVRKAGRSGEAAISSRARKLEACKGLKGCDFAECALDAMGKLPKNLLKVAESCPTLRK
jgi:hypothetical protein